MKRYIRYFNAYKKKVPKTKFDYQRLEKAEVKRNRKRAIKIDEEARRG